MSVLEILILAVGLSMDAFAVSICKGLAVKDISFKKAAIVGLWFGGFQALISRACADRRRGGHAGARGARGAL